MPETTPETQLLQQVCIESLTPAEVDTMQELAANNPKLAQELKSPLGESETVLVPDLKPKLGVIAARETATTKDERLISRYSDGDLLICRKYPDGKTISFSHGPKGVSYDSKDGITSILIAETPFVKHFHTENPELDAAFQKVNKISDSLAQGHYMIIRETKASFTKGKDTDDVSSTVTVTFTDPRTHLQLVTTNDGSQITQRLYAVDSTLLRTEVLTVNEDGGITGGIDFDEITRQS